LLLQILTPPLSVGYVGFSGNWSQFVLESDITADKVGYGFAVVVRSGAHRACPISRERIATFRNPSAPAGMAETPPFHASAASEGDPRE
jgi:hypothetical protein